MLSAWRTYAFLLAVACGGDRAPGKDTALVDELPPDDSASPPRVSAWNRAAGEFFAVRSDSAGQSFVVNPAYGDAQALDTLTAAEWNVEGSSLVLFDGAKIVGTARIIGFHYDSTCAGWPTATLVSETAASASWRIAFPEGRVQGLPFDSLPALPPSVPVRVRSPRRGWPTIPSPLSADVRLPSVRHIGSRSQPTRS
jgi:hypothetical protein